MKPHCHECGGDHDPSGAHLDCIRHWKLRAIQAENKLLVQQIYGDALQRIINYPVHPMKHTQRKRHKANPTWGTTACGRELFLGRAIQTSARWTDVTCKKCLKAKP